MAQKYAFVLTVEGRADSIVAWNGADVVLIGNRDLLICQSLSLLACTR